MSESSIRVVLLRHAEAVPEHPELPDLCRYLTEAGRAAAKQIGEQLATTLGNEVVFWSSPLVRAVQTAELASMAFPNASVFCQPELALDGDIHSVHRKLRIKPPTTLIAVGHEPTLSALGALCVDAEFPEIDRAEAALVERGKLMWMMKPGQVARSV